MKIKAITRFAAIAVLLAMDLGLASAQSSSVKHDILIGKVAALNQADRIEEALPIFEELDRSGFEPTEGSTYYRIRALDKAGRVDETLSRGQQFLERFGKASRYYGQVIAIVSQRTLEKEQATARQRVRELELAAQQRAREQELAAQQRAAELERERVNVLERQRELKYQAAMIQYRQSMAEWERGLPQHKQEVERCEIARQKMFDECWAISDKEASKFWVDHGKVARQRAFCVERYNPETCRENLWKQYRAQRPDEPAKSDF